MYQSAVFLLSLGIATCTSVAGLVARPGTLLLTSGAAVYQVDTTTGELIGQLQAEPGRSIRSAAMYDGKLYLLEGPRGSYFGQLRSINIADGSTNWSRTEEPYNNLSISNGELVGADFSYVSRFDLATGNRLDIISVRMQVEAYGNYTVAHDTVRFGDRYFALDTELTEFGGGPAPVLSFDMQGAFLGRTNTLDMRTGEDTAWGFDIDQTSGDFWVLIRTFVNGYETQSAKRMQRYGSAVEQTIPLTFTNERIWDLSYVSVPAAPTASLLVLTSLFAARRRRA
jgi:hypothetical protein